MGQLHQAERASCFCHTCIFIRQHCCGINMPSQGYHEVTSFLLNCLCAIRLLVRAKDCSEKRIYGQRRLGQRRRGQCRPCPCMFPPSVVHRRITSLSLADLYFPNPECLTRYSTSLKTPILNSIFTLGNLPHFVPVEVVVRVALLCSV